MNEVKKKRGGIPAEKLAKYSKGEGLNAKNIKNLIHRKRIIRKEQKVAFAEKIAARAEVLLTEEAGFLVPEKGEATNRVKQSDIKNIVDITSAAKCFELDLNFGPYRLDYSRNGRYLLLGGRRGHVAAIDWITKRLMCEINVMEAVYDIQWLHIETMYAVAQKEWVFMYDNKGVELHCVKALNRVLQMTYLPYHFLLATSNEQGWLSWLDISIGKLVNSFSTYKGRLSTLTHNPYNAVLCVGHPTGVVTMWSPNVKRPLAQIMCHKTPVQGIAVDHTGKYMATSSVDRNLRIWDVREMSGPVQTYKFRDSPIDLSFSQRGLLAAAFHGNVEIFKDCHLKTVADSYMKHKLTRTIHNLEFCPYEDVLGVATGCGFTSMLVPGAGEPNYDAYESNPMQTKRQRQESEVKSLLEKIQPEMITLDPNIIVEVDLPTLKDKVEAKKKALVSVIH
ncbi:hypothetical protein AAG570_011175 [Ranatra chinensis]|uniref:BING4 C-terminal domain-containing protein n=1 Tax=Ranatra chinensis TaxID=642074 RepID=A0ABD0Z644_9HEMI